MLKRRLGLLIFLVVAGLLIYLVYQNNSRNKINEILALKRVTVVQKDLQKVISASGSVIANEVRVVYPAYTGTIYQLDRQLNDQVQKDQFIGKIEITTPANWKYRRDFKAPVAGTITKMNIALGQPVITNQTPMFEISNLNDLKIVVAISETEITKVNVDQIVNITFQGLKTESITGRVTVINSAPNITSTDGVASYNISIKMDSLPAGIKVGMSADVEIATESKQDVLAVSESFIFDREGKKYAKVFKQNGNDISIFDAEVTLGFKTDTEVEILSGLTAGDELIIPTAELKNSRSSLNLFGGFTQK